MHYLPALILSVILATAAAPAHSHSGDRWRGEVSLEVVSDRGGAFQSIPHQEFWNGGTHILKRYLEARKGETYSIVIRNRAPERVGVVIAVDGRNIISGKASNLGSSEDMYLVDGYGHARYDGWRTDRETVHRFYFTETADSYAVRTFKDSTAMGVIAVAVYRERERPKRQFEQRGGENAPAAPSVGGLEMDRSGAARDEAAGTGFGDARYSPVVRVAFEPEPSPVQKTLVKYEWREVLCRKGILSCRQGPGNRLWDEEEYAPFPPGYPRN